MLKISIFSVLVLMTSTAIAGEYMPVKRHHYAAKKLYLQPLRTGPGVNPKYATRAGDPVDNGSPYPNRLLPDGSLTGPIPLSAHN